MLVIECTLMQRPPCPYLHPVILNDIRERHCFEKVGLSLNLLNLLISCVCARQGRQRDLFHCHQLTGIEVEAKDHTSEGTTAQDLPTLPFDGPSGGTHFFEVQAGCRVEAAKVGCLHTNTQNAPRIYNAKEGGCVVPQFLVYVCVDKPTSLGCTGVGLTAERGALAEADEELPTETAGMKMTYQTNRQNNKKARLYQQMRHTTHTLLAIASAITAGRLKVCNL